MGRKKEKRSEKERDSVARHENGPGLIQSTALFHILMHDNNNESKSRVFFF